MVMEPSSWTHARKPVIAILLGAPLTPQNYERSGIPYLSERFDVVVVDCNRWLRKGFSTASFAARSYSQIVEVSSRSDFALAIARLRADFAIDFIGFGPITGLIQRVLRGQGTKYVVQMTGTVPIPSARGMVRARLARAVRDPVNFARSALGRIRNRFGPSALLPPDVALLAGRRSLDGFTSRASSIVWIASNDYHTYRGILRDRAQVSGSSVPGPYAVFIDDCIVMASDYKLLGLRPPMDPADYFALLLSAFDKLERVTGLRILVAAHPNGADLPAYSALFGGREVRFGDTAGLCDGSELVVSHGSTGLSFAVLGKKPIIVFTSTALDRSFQGAGIRERSVQIQCPLLFMEAEEAAFRTAHVRSAVVNETAYERYIDNYIVTSDSTEAAPWEAFSEFVSRRPGP